MSAIEVHHLNKAYGDFTAVHDVSFTVEPGEVFCLLGPNGAGKTTTTEILEGYRGRTGGDVRVLGHDPAVGGRTLREQIGIVLQECGLQEDLTVAETLDLYGAYYPRRLPTEAIIELVELDAKSDDRVGNLSGGQRRRLDVGLALVGDPELVFLDEPTTGFDPAARRHSWSVFRSLAALGKTILLTTHFMDEAEALADRIAVVSAGRIVAAGTPAELGGRDRAATTITVTVPAGTTTASLPSLGEVDVAIDGQRLTVTAADGTTALHRLTGWALAAGHPLDDLTVARPSLEDTYLALTQTTQTTQTTSIAKETVR